jgi:SAM-dependent methyltransferase
VNKHLESTLGRALGLWRQYASRTFDEAMILNLENIGIFLSEFSKRQSVSILDLGCWDGANLVGYAASGAQLTGVEMSHPAAILASHRSVRVIQADLNDSLPFGDQSFDVVTSNQVIEHLCDTDIFLRESHRVLRPGGLVIVSTENLSSWHNVFALMLGWQAFSLSNVSHLNLGLGNPLAIHRGSEQSEKGMEHQRIFSYRGLQELLRCHGFARVRIAGAGYYPLPGRVGRIDPRHAAFLTAAAIRS